MHAIVDLAARSGATKLKTEGSFCDPNLLAGSKKKSRVTKKQVHCRPVDNYQSSQNLV